ncbi:MAG: PhoH family protein [Planctomycetota bacterium]|nr:PhoH family protein [Planctomycetota bacterium]
MKGNDEGVQEARRRIEHLLGKSRKGRELALADIEAILLGTDAASAAEKSTERASERRPGNGYRVVRSSGANSDRSSSDNHEPRSASSRPRPVPSAHATTGMRMNALAARNENQRRYLELIEKSALTFGVGPAGTGKTFLAVAAAVRALRTGACRRVVITRPVVEAGERLGFLPGDLQAKLDPYMRPVYDSFYDLIDPEEVLRLEENGVIEVAPLAYMRGRTLNHAFAILDEGQNTSIMQMKMFLTRLGEGSRMVVTGDPSQTDLEHGARSGLNDAVSRLRGFKDIGVVEFTMKDIVRHPLVETIVRAYEAPSRIPREGERYP